MCAIRSMNTFTILDYYMKEVRVHLELAVPVCQSGLTYKLTADLERVQRVAVGILVGGVPYAQACATIGLKPLQVRRLELCEQFAVSTASEESRHSNLFKAQKNPRTNKEEFRDHFCRKSRFFKSPLLYLTRILNNVWIPYMLFNTCKWQTMAERVCSWFCDSYSNRISLYWAGVYCYI